MPSGEAETNPCLLGETNPAPPRSGKAETIPQPSGETEPALKGRARRRLALGPRARWNQAPVIPARGEATLLCVQKFLTFGGYWFHLLGYPGIWSPASTILVFQPDKTTPAPYKIGGTWLIKISQSSKLLLRPFLPNLFSNPCCCSSLNPTIRIAS